MATILYIENDHDNMLVVQRALEARGHACVWAPNGLDGLELAYAYQPDLILLDINLPDIDGHEVVRRLRANHRHRLFHVPVIALTANGLRGAALNALAAGCNVYMLKPISIRELWAQVETALNESARAQVTAEAWANARDH